jgi:hypothetical protein
MIPAMLDAARQLGKRAGRQNRPVTECPYTTQGGGDQRAAARAWVGEWLRWSSTRTAPLANFDDDDE